MTQQAMLDYRNPLLAVENEPEAMFYGFSAVSWLKIVTVAVLMAATFRFNLLRLWLKTNPINGEPNWRHAVCVPLIGIYYLIVHREELLETRTYTAWTGLGILLFGILLFAYGIYPGQNDFVKDFGMIVALFGVVTFLCGWQVMKIAWFPIVFLICAIPWPELVYSYVASPLQHLAAKVAVHVLSLTNVEAHSFGTKIIINAKGNVWRTLNVAEACAGLRSLMTFISVAAAIAFLSARPLWQKIIVTFSAIPIAIFCNVMRVTGQGFLDHYWSQELSEGFAHQFVGIVMLVPGFFMILFVGWLLDVVFVEVVDEREARRKRVSVLTPTKPVEWTTPRNGLAETSTAQVVAKWAVAPSTSAKVAGMPPTAPVKMPAVKVVPRPSTAGTPGVARSVGVPAAGVLAGQKPAVSAAVALPRAALKPSVGAVARPAGAAPLPANAKPAVAVVPARAGVVAPVATNAAAPTKRPVVAMAPAAAIKPLNPTVKITELPEAR